LGRGETYTGFWWGNLKERDHWGDPGVDGRIILRWICCNIKYDVTFMNYCNIKYSRAPVSTDSVIRGSPRPEKSLKIKEINGS
jgi:hypothetical protein